MTLRSFPPPFGVAGVVLGSLAEWVEAPGKTSSTKKRCRTGSLVAVLPCRDTAVHAIADYLVWLIRTHRSGQVLADGVVPRRIIATSAHFLRAAAGINPPNGVRIHVAGVDLIRDEQGTFRVLEDNVRIPSGVSYVMENRRAMAQVLPEVFAATRILPVESYPG